MDTDENGMNDTHYFEIESNMENENRFSCPTTSTKIERRYELQRKIDEELRKLQLTETMEQTDDNQEPRNDAGTVTRNSNVITTKKENCSNVEECLNNDEELSLHEVVHMASPADEINTIQERQHDGYNEAKINGVESFGIIAPTCHESDSVIGNDESCDVVQSDSENVESDYVANSSTMTSPTTTTGTFTLPTHSPGTEEDLTEDIFPVDKVPDTFRDQLHIASSSSPQGMDVSEISSDVFFGQELSQKLSNTEVGTEGILIPESPQIVVASIFSPVTDIIENDNDTSTDVQNCNYANDDKIDDSIKFIDVVNENLSPVMGLPESNSIEDIQTTFDNTEVVTVEPPREFSNDTVQGAEQLSDLITDIDGNLDMKHEDSPQSPENISPNLVSKNDNIETSLGKEETTVGTLIVVDTDSSNVEESSETYLTLTEIKLEAENVQVEEIQSPHEETDDSVNRKISTDEDEYSGYDIEICEPTSYQEDASIADDDASSESSNSSNEYEVTKPYSFENESLFVDVKYSVGNQINSSGERVARDDNNITVTDENYENPEIVPWGSDGVLLTIDNDNPNESLSSDKAQTASSSSRSTLSDTVEFEELSARVAEDTVKSAIQAAYEITLNMPSDDADKNVTELTDETPQSENIENPADNTTRDDDYQIQSAENPASNEVESEIVFNEASPVIEGVKLSPLDDAKSRESIVTCDEEIPVVLTTNEISEVTQSNEADIRTAVEAQKENLIITQGDITEENENNSEIVLNTESTESVVETIGNASLENKELPDQNSEKIKETENESEDMVRINESSGHTRNLPDRISYSPALSQRNTEATKWFGQSTSEDKIWMKSSGKVDENAEQERKRLIKAMTRKHNPKLIPKWQPPVEKDFAENLDEKQKASLQKYEDRRRSRSDVGWNNGNHSYQPVIINTNNTTQSINKESPHVPVQRENIVIESVVHSKDAIGVWESRLSEKQHKEQLENQRLSAGKQKKRRDRAASDFTRQRKDSSSSVSSTTSSILPTSEHIERESMDVSKVRNRWRNIEEESSKTKSSTNSKKEPSRRSFTVNAAPPYRSFQSPTPTKAPVIVVAKTHERPPVQSSHQQNESFIDREIREAAEREEKWKHEQWEKMSEISAASSEDVFPDHNIPPPSNDSRLVTTLYTQSLPTVDAIGLDIINDAEREESWKEGHLHMGGNIKKTNSAPRNLSKDSSGIGSMTGSEIASPPPQFFAKTNKDLDLESLSSFGSSETGNELPSPPSLSEIAKDKIDFTEKLPGGNSAPNIHHQKLQDSTDSGIECSVSTTTFKSPEMDAVLTKPTQKKSRSTPLSPKSPPLEPVAEQMMVAIKSPTVSTTLLTVEPMLKPEVKQIELSPPAKTIQPVTKIEPPVVKHSPTTKNIEAPKQKQVQTNHVYKKESTREHSGPRKGGPVFNKKTGPVGVTSSKSQLQTVMEREMREAADREEEWRHQQLELVNHGIDVTAQPIVHSTREIRTPISSNAPPPVNSGEQVPETRVVKSLFADDRDESPVRFTEESSDSYKKRAVKKALKIPKRKSMLAMRWEEGNFQNNFAEEEK